MDDILKRYSQQQRDSINQFFIKLASISNKTGKMLDSKKSKIVQSWEQYPADIVIQALEVYISMDIEKSSNGRGKNEKYVLGIIRNKAGEAHGTGDKAGNSGEKFGNGAGADQGKKLQSIIRSNRPVDDELECDF